MNRNKCPECLHEMTSTNIKGSLFPWKDYPEVELKFDFIAIKCSNCGEMLLKGKELAELDSLLENSIRKQTSDNLQRVKEKSRLSQKKLASKLGITEVYFSELIGEKKTPSLQIFNYLKILSNHPDAITSLESFSGQSHKQPVYPESSLQKYHYLNDEEKSRIPSHSTFINILSDASRGPLEVFH